MDNEMENDTSNEWKSQDQGNNDLSKTPEELKKRSKRKGECIGDLHKANEECNALKEMLPTSIVSDCHICYFGPSKLGFRCCFRLRLDTVEEVKRFLAMFQEKSYVTWRLQSTNPTQMSAGKKNLFWARYRCQSSNDRIDKNATRPHAKHSGCNANMVVTLKRRPSNRKSRSKDPHMPDFPTVVKISHEHNHLLFCADALKFRDVSKGTTDKFKLLFQAGHSPASALNIHKFDLQWDYAETYIQTLSDRFICPDYQWTHRLYRKVFNKEYGPPKEALLENLETKINEINSQSDVPLIKMEQVLSQTMIAICTPLMRRVHSFLPQSGNIAYLEASGAMERHNHRIFLLLTHSCAGGLPLGVIITTSESETVISHGLEMIKHLVNDEGFYDRGKKGPKVFMTDDSTVQQNALAECFPECTVLLSVYNILQTMWQWLWDAKHKVPLADRAPLMYFLKYLLHVWGEDELNSCYNAMLRDPIALKHPHYLDYLARLWERRQQWAVMLHLEPASNIAGSIIKVMKDTLLHRLKYYNIIQLVDFIFSRMDLYYQRRISDVVSGNYESAMRHRYMPADSASEEFDIKRLSEDLFEAFSEKANSVYQINVAIGRCSCRIGQCGAPCKHQYAVVKNYDVTSFCFFSVDDMNTKELLLKVSASETSDSNVCNTACSELVDESLECSHSPNPNLVPAPAAQAEQALEVQLEETSEQDNAEYNVIPCDSGIFSDAESDCVQSDCLKGFEKFYEEICNKIRNQPKIFRPAISKFLENYSNFSSDLECAAALSSFGIGALSHSKRPLDGVCNSESSNEIKKKR